jgi:hypothetical protein
MIRAAEWQDDLDSDERRGEERIDFVCPVLVVTEDERLLAFLIRDLSLSGVRLLGTDRLLGEKVRVLISNPNGSPWSVWVRILWTCPVTQDLVENGGTILPRS